MKQSTRIIVKLLVALALLGFTACGGGGGGGGGGSTSTSTSGSGSGAVPVTTQQAVASLALTGGTDSIGSLQFALNLPEGFSLATEFGGELASGVFTVSIAGTTLLQTDYLPEDNVYLGELTIGLISEGGFSPGTVATVTHDLVTGQAVPLASGFTVSNLLVEDLNGQELFGYSVDISVQQTQTQ